MSNRNENLSSTPMRQSRAMSNESGAALASAVLMLALLSAVAMTVLAVVRTETRIAGSDLKRTQTFYAASAGIEKMTSDFSQLFTKTSRPSTSQMNRIAATPPPELATEGYSLSQSLIVDDATLTAMRATQGISAPAFPNVVMPTDSPFAGLNASVQPFTLTSTATFSADGTQVSLTRQMNNYLIPIFQFGVFSDKDLEFWPEPPMTFNGRVHANGNIYFGGDITFLQRVTTANEAVRNVMRNGTTNTTTIGGYYASNPRWKIGSTTVAMGQGSVVNGPYLTPQPRTDGRGDFPDSPAGTDNAGWKSYSVNPFSGLLLSKSTGVLPLKLPLQLQEVNKQPMEVIKRSMPDDDLPGFDALGNSRFQNKAKIRILIDDEGVGNGTSNAAGIGNTSPSSGIQKGVNLSSFNPIELDSGKALRLVSDAGTYTATDVWYQGDPARNKPALVVRGVRNDYNGLIAAATANANTGGSNATAANLTSNTSNASIPKTSNNAVIPTGAGIKGRILIEIVPPPNVDGTPRDPIDVTTQILSMGMTVGEPNAIVMLQRPQWAAFLQGGRERKGGNWYLNYFLDNSVTNRRALADGEIIVSAPFNAFGFLASATDNSLDDDPHSSTSNQFLPTAATMARDDKPGTGLNKIVPINVYNVREGHVDEASTANVLYQRGITSVIDINMRNLARWLDGVYDTNLLNGTQAVSSNIDGSDGYVVYISDRRGDRVKSERDANGNTIQTTNGFVDNEDIYGFNQADGATPDPGEDVIDDGYDPATSLNKKGSLQVDKCELPSPSAVTPASSTKPTGAATVDQSNWDQAIHVTNWSPTVPSSMSTACTSSYASSNQYWFRRGVRVMNGENLQVLGTTGKLSTTKGITISTENMLYVWGNFNTTGINTAPLAGESNLNDPSATARYTGNQVPASLVADAFFPLSKTWYDALPAQYPEGGDNRIADAGALTDTTAIAVGAETSVRAGVISGSTLSYGTTAPTYFLDGLNGGVHNFPRFLETWSNDVREERWNYVGSFICLYNSQQALSPWSVAYSIVYYPPIRKWAFDITFTDPNRLPPGTPQFQHVEPTGFRQVLY